MLQAPARMLTPLLADGDAAVRQATLVALARGPGPTEATTLLGLLGDESPAVRGAAALALARHHPELAARAISDRVWVEVNADRVLYDDYVRRNKPPLTAAEIGRIMDAYRCQMKMMQALAMVPGAEATKALEEQAFRGGEDFARMNSVVAAFALWNRIGTDPARAVEELGSKDPGVADKAEWMLVQGGPDLLGWVRKAATAADPATRRRAVEVLAIQGDAEALAAVRSSADGSEGVKNLAARAPRNSAGGSPAR